MEDKREFFECVCFSHEHTLQFSCDKGESDYPPSFYTSIFLCQYRNIFKRIWIAIKYIFNYKCIYGHWDCWEIKRDDADRMIKMLEEYKKHWDEWQKQFPLLDKNGAKIGSTIVQEPTKSP